MRTGLRRPDTKKNDLRLPLEHWEYGDPEAVAERRQTRSCHGCRHESKSEWGGITWSSVKKGKNTAFVVHFFKKGNMTNEI